MDNIKLLIICYVPEIVKGDNMNVLAQHIESAFVNAGNKINNKITFDVIKITKVDRNLVLNDLKQIAEYLEQPNNKAIVYYFGHGDQIRDMNGDEEDHKDEIWKTQNIIDDEITEIFKNINEKSYLFMFSDACSSGSMIDDNNKRNWITISATNDVQDALAEDDGGVFTLYGLIPALNNLQVHSPKNIHDYIKSAIDIDSQTTILRTGKKGIENVNMFS